MWTSRWPTSSALVLVIARVVAGAAAALMAAQVLTGIQLGFTGRARGRALGLYALVLSAGAVAGQSLGGLLISADVLGTTWRPAFLVNVPIGVALYWLAWRYLPAGRRRPGRLDLASMTVFSVAMLLLVVSLVLGQDAGWPVWTWVFLAASIPGFAAPPNACGCSSRLLRRCLRVCGLPHRSRPRLPRSRPG
jgi:predicted MFS family arabinose efflux permease